MRQKLISFIVFLLAMLCSAMPLAAQKPSRVVSMNLCTDQLVLLLADASQILSLSHLAKDRDISALYAQAGSYPANHERAEEVYALKPDLVVTGTFSTRNTSQLLRKLGYRVEEFAPANSFKDIEAQLLQMGDLLGQREKANQLVLQMRERLHRLALIHASEKVKPIVAVAYYRGGYISGSDTLMGQVINAAGYINLADRLSIKTGARVSLEVLVAEKPDIIITGRHDYGAGLQEFQNQTQPLLRQWQKENKIITIPDRLTMCGGPFTLDAIDILSGEAP